MSGAFVQELNFHSLVYQVMKFDREVLLEQLHLPIRICVAYVVVRTTIMDAHSLVVGGQGLPIDLNAQILPHQPGSCCYRLKPPCIQVFTQVILIRLEDARPCWSY